MNIWLTADTHFGHKAIIDHCGRPFKSEEEMNEAMIGNWNAVVAPKDTVWHLGDFSYRSKPEVYFDRLNGKISLCLGNHDKPNLLRRLPFVEVCDTKYLRWEGERFFLSHYAHRVWRNSHRGTYHLYGHSHGQLPDYGRSMDVGVDAIARLTGGCYGPVRLSVVADYLRDREYAVHHEGMAGVMHGREE